MQIVEINDSVLVAMSLKVEGWTQDAVFEEQFENRKRRRL